MKKKILITGSSGQLAQEFIAYFRKNKVDCVSFDKETLNIADQTQVEKTISQNKPDIVLNCAAFNDVNQAQINFEAALDVNMRGVSYLAQSCRKEGCFLVHYSTDFVFDGLKKDYYTEDDKPLPVNLYGESKRLGEDELKKHGKDYLLLRVSWVFGGLSASNFLLKLDELAKIQKNLIMTTDFVSIPSYTKDIVEYTIMLLEKKSTGTYNVANASYASKYELARYYLNKRGYKNLVLPVTSDYFPQDAKRPYFSALSTAKLAKELKIIIPEWTDAVNRYCSQNL